ncbi:MAG TPA: CoA pyrophosphatase [Allosphingosinicella sp.]|nr:CoA pyrophosphatase [Allosphingosinicella sp.]
MSLAATLREALKLGRRSDPILLEGDAFDPLEEGRQPITPAAVLVPVVERPDPTVILTLRPDTLRRHAGQIAFPGGRIDPHDRDETDAALREAEEEIGLQRADVDVVGVADRYRTITGFEVTPVVGVVPPDLPLTPQAEEVAAIFEAPLHYLLRPEHHVVRTIEWQGRERCYYEILWEDRRIWGATAAMIVNLSRRLALVS